MIIESGLIVAVGMLFTFLKLGWKKRMWCLSRPLFCDIVIFIGLNILHWGTFSGVMVAATGAMVCSGMLTLGRWTYGYMEERMYYPGIMDVSQQLI